MNINSYIKQDPQDFSNNIKKLESSLPYYTKHLNKLRSNISQIHSIVKFNEANKHNNSILKELESQLAFNSFLTTSTLDLIIISKGIFQSRHIWEEIFYLRQSYLIIYETIKTYTKYSNSIKTMVFTNYSDNKIKFEIITNKLRDFKKEFNYNTTIADIRNYTSGHIDSNFINYFDKVNSMDFKIATRANFSFINVLNEMRLLSEDIASSTNIKLQESSNETNSSFNNYLINLNQLFKNK